MRATPTPAGLRSHEGYMSMAEFEKLKRTQRARFGWRPFVYICSPYSGDVEASATLAQEFCRVAIERHKIPVAPHLLFPQFLNDSDPHQRELAMFMNRILLGRMHVIWVYADRITAGMRQEIEWAYRQGTPIRYFNANFKEIK